MREKKQTNKEWVYVKQKKPYIHRLRKQRSFIWYIYVEEIKLLSNMRVIDELVM